MKKNIILEFDSISSEALDLWLKETDMHLNINLFILTRPERKDKFLSVKSRYPQIECINYDDLLLYQSNNLSLVTYHDFIKYFLKDSLPARFLDREGYFPHYGIGVQNAFAYYTDLAYNLLSYLIDHKIEMVYYRNTPHEFVEFFLARAAEYLDLNLITSEQLVFPWIFTLRKGIGKKREWIFKDNIFENKETLKRDIGGYVKKLNGKYEDAMPLYEKDRLGKGLFKHFNPFENPMHLLKRPQKFWAMSRNFVFYKKHSKTIDFKNQKYFLFFLHYQPERSTLPEGYGFEDQFYAIKILSKMLPEGVRLIVKEHPSMFLRGSEFKIRSLYNYQSILSLSNVDLCKMNMDNFQLMDNALAVSTITGTVALEGYVRKTPVILFGRSVFNIEGVHGFTSIPNLQDFVDDAIAGRVKIDDVEENLLNLCAKGSFSGLDDEYPIIDYYTKRKYKQNAHFKSLTVLLKDMLNGH